VKQVFLEQHAKLPLYKVAGYEVSRVKGQISLTSDGEVFDELKLDQGTLAKGPSLFLVPKNYKLQELQHFLVQQFNISTHLQDAQLSYKDKVLIKIQQG
jgi:hypothetical protein